MPNNYLWLVGALCSALGSTCCNLGINTQKYAFMVDDNAGIDRPYYKKPLWCLGLFLIVVGSFGDFAALGMAAQSIVAPIGSVTLVANMFFAHFWLGEDISWRDCVGTVCIIAGATLAVVFGDHAQQSYNLDDLVALFDGTGFDVYAAGLSFYIVSLYGAAKYIEPIRNHRDTCDAVLDKARRADKQDRASIAEAAQAQESAEKRYIKFAKLHRFSYCTLSGVFGGTNILFGKMVSELLSSTFRGENQLVNPLFYVFFVVMFMSIFLQLHFLAKALMYFDAMYVVPVFQCFLVSVSAVGGAAYFREFDHFTATQWICFPTGVGLALWGMISLSGRTLSGNRRVRVPSSEQEARELEGDNENYHSPPGSNDPHASLEMTAKRRTSDQKIDKPTDDIPSRSREHSISGSKSKGHHSRTLSAERIIISQARPETETVGVAAYDALHILGKEKTVLIESVNEVKRAPGRFINGLMSSAQDKPEEESGLLKNDGNDHDRDSIKTKLEEHLVRKNNTSSVPDLNMLRKQNADAEEPTLAPLEILSEEGQEDRSA